MSGFVCFSTTPQVLSPTITSPPNALPRRSSRLFTSDSSTTKVKTAGVTVIYCFLGWGLSVTDSAQTSKGLCL